MTVAADRERIGNVGIIHILDISVANLIAAGEVVERPASAVKELVENSIDAGASAVTVEIAKGGVAFLRVTDNGCGMSGEDAVTCVRRHATSKLHTAEDLLSILTLGFRGEALAAITSVCEFRIMTKRRGDAAGTLLCGAYGKTEEVSETGCPDGTTVICERLFATTPARLKFLKSDASETAAVSQAMERLALSHPEIAFRFLADGVLKFATAGDGKLQNAIYAVYGGAFATKLIPVSGGSEGIRISGYISSPENTRGNRGMQQFFINSRCVKSKTLTAALEAAYRSYIPSEKFPSCVLNLEIPAASVDVNIHPAKLEVKFSREKAVFDAVYSAVRGTLAEKLARPALTLSGHGTLTEAEPAAPSSPEERRPPIRTPLDLLFDAAARKGAESEQAGPCAVQKQEPPADDGIPVDIPPLPAEGGCGFSPRLGAETDMDSLTLRERLYGASVREVLREGMPAAIRETAEQSGMPVKPAEAGPASDSLQNVPAPAARGSTDAGITGAAARPVPEYRIVGEVFSTYVILETEGKLILFDKHAAHERIHFERMRAGMDTGARSVQMLLASEPLALTPAELSAAKEYREELSAVGFEFDISEKEIILRGIPQDLALAEAKSLFSELAASVLESGEPLESQRRAAFERALYQSSCKASVKGGRVYDEAHIRWICENLLRYDCIKFCPHGRPVAFEISKKELDSRFGRT